LHSVSYVCTQLIFTFNPSTSFASLSKMSRFSAVLLLVVAFVVVCSSTASAFRIPIDTRSVNTPFTPANWTYCASGGGSATVSSVGLTPNPPQRSTDCNVTLAGASPTVISGGNVQLTISFDGLQVYSNTWQVCNIAGIKCPIAAKTNLTATLTIPGSAIPPIAPSGQYIGVGSITDQTGALLMCVDVPFTLS